jgi:hypothetical protein
VLTRYRLYRGPRPAGDPLPAGVRQDTRMHTGHCLRPERAAVEAYLAEPTPAAWRAFARAYRQVLAARFAADRAPFDALAAAAAGRDVHLGCSCPTAKNPDVRRCHTWLALEFMRRRYPRLEVVFPTSI